MSGNWLDKWVNKSLIKDSSFVDCEGHSCYLMRCACLLLALRPSHTTTFTQHWYIPKHLHSKFYAHNVIAFMQLHSLQIEPVSLCLHHATTFAWSNCASAFTLQLLCLIYAADLTLIQFDVHLDSSIHTAAFTPQNLPCLHTATFMLLYCCLSHSATFVQLLSRCCSDAAAFVPQLSHHSTGAATLTQHHQWHHIHTATFTPLHSQSIYAAAFVQQYFCCTAQNAAYFSSSHAAA